MKNSFFLVIPEQKNDPQSLASFTESALQRWVSDLPSANPGLATRLFQDLIGELISLEMSTANRLSALELLRSTFFMIEDYLRSRLIKSGFPKGDVERKIFALVVLIEKQYTIGYWMVVRDLTRRDIGWLQGKNTLLSMQRAIKGLSSIVISHYMMGAPVPDWIWYDLHSLYKLACKLGKESSRVSDQAGLFSKSSSIEDSYKQILLLSLVFPSGLTQRELLLVYEFIGKICDQVSIEKKPLPDQQLQCILLLDEDQPPSFSGNSQEQTDKRSDSVKLYLNLGKLHKMVKQTDKYASKEEARFSSLEQGNIDSHKLSAELFDYLMQRWQGQEPHGTALFNDRLNRYIAIGFDATHELQDINQPPSPNLEIMAQTYSERALYCPFPQEGLLYIGSLISFRKTDSQPHQRNLGVICRIQLPKQDNTVVFEITQIAQQSFSVSYQMPEGSDDFEQKKGLLYGVTIQGQERSYIILESFMVKDGDVLRMFMGAENFPIILMGRKNIGLGYWQFECRRIMEKPVTQQPQTSKKGYDFI